MQGFEPNKYFRLCCILPQLLVNSDELEALRWSEWSNLFSLKLLQAYDMFENIKLLAALTVLLPALILKWVQTHTRTHARIHTRTHTHARTHARTHAHTHVGFYGLRGLSIDVMVFILYKLCVLLPYTYPTPKLSPHRRLCICTVPPPPKLCTSYHTLYDL